MLPDTDHLPARLVQGEVVLAVAGHVPLELGLPVIDMGAGNIPMIGAAVPEAPINENRDSKTHEDDVDSTFDPRWCGVLSESETTSMQR